MCILKFCNFACSNRPYNDAVGNAILPLREYKQGILKSNHNSNNHSDTNFRQTVCNHLREVGAFPRRPARLNVLTPGHLAVVPEEGEIDKCQMEDCFILKYVSPIMCLWTHTSL